MGIGIRKKDFFCFLGKTSENLDEMCSHLKGFGDDVLGRLSRQGITGFVMNGPVRIGEGVGTCGEIQFKKNESLNIFYSSIISLGKLENVFIIDDLRLSLDLKDQLLRLLNVSATKVNDPLCLAYAYNVKPAVRPWAYQYYPVFVSPCTAEFTNHLAQVINVLNTIDQNKMDCSRLALRREYSFAHNDKLLLSRQIVEETVNFILNTTELYEFIYANCQGD